MDTVPSNVHMVHREFWALARIIWQATGRGEWSGSWRRFVSGRYIYVMTSDDEGVMTHITCCSLLTGKLLWWAED